MTDTAMKYSYELVQEPRPQHIWALRGPKGGAHVWAVPNLPEWVEAWGDQFYGGVERHSPVPVYDSDDATKPHHENCFLLNGPCWHDGTSLYFSEHIEPHLRGAQPFDPWVHSFINGVLLDFYESRFGTTGEEQDQ